MHHQGFLLGEIMRRVTGKTVGPFLRKEVTTPLARRVLHRRDDEAEQAHVAEVMPNMDARLFAAKDGVPTRTLAPSRSRSCRTRPSPGP